MEYRRSPVEFPPRRIPATLARPAQAALALSLTASIAAAAPPAPVQTGVASYYAPQLAGKPTASGEPLKPNALTAASRSLPLGATAKVTNTENGRSVTVEITDRGPYAKNRVLDVSPKAAEHLGFKDDGVANVAVQPLKAPPER